MRYHEYDDDEFKNEIDNMFGESPEDYSEEFSIDHLLYPGDLGGVEEITHSELMGLTMSIVEKSFFWRFLSIQAKLKKIRLVYEELSDLVYGEK